MKDFLKEAKIEYLRIRKNFHSFHLQWHLTNQCNFRCQHCYQNDYGKPVLTLAKMKKIFDDFLRIIKEKKRHLSEEKAGRYMLSITGGEPLLYENFDELMRYVAKYKKGFELNLLSNGSLLNEKTLKRIFKEYKFDNIQISLEGMEKVNDSIRGAGSFKKALRALMLVKKMGKQGRISFTMHKQNISQVPGLANLAYRIGIPVGFRRLVLDGSAAARLKMLTPSELKAIYQYLNRLKEKLGNKVSFILGCESGLLAQWEDLRAFPVGFCSAMLNGVLTPLPDGRVLSCRRLPVQIGDLNKERIYNIYKRVAKGKYALEMEKMPNNCRKCEYFSKCLGGSRCVAACLSGGDLYAPDRQCPKLK